MKRSLLTMCAVLLALAAQAQKREPKTAALMTSWGEQIDPENVWQEYPRPQMVRTEWMNLNGVWEYFRRDNTIRLEAESTIKRFNKRILVPFGVESALSGIQETDLGAVAKSTLMYRRTFTLPESYKNKRILLHFGAVDWQCSVFVNRTLAGQHVGGSDPFTIDITDCLKAQGEQELQVAVYDLSSSGGQPRGKQTTNPGSIWYTSCSGIWQTVWLEPVSDCHIERYELVPDAATGTVRVKVIASDPTCKFYLVARDGEEMVASTEKVRVSEEVTLTIPNAKLWSPDAPFLYNLDIYLCRDNCEECDRARGYFGLRTLSMALIDGHPGFLLNGQPLFMYGPLDQGWWPDGLLTPPSYEAMIYDLQTIKLLGMNMVRKHIKVENDLWYEWCDRNGLIVWQDMPSGSDSGNLGTKEEIHQNFYTECEHIVTALKQHPCICVWVPYNEGWGQDAGSGADHTKKGYLVVRSADADTGRLMNAASGWTDFRIGDIADAHNYPSPNASGNPGNRVNVCGEFGGITYLIDGHLWGGNDQVYTSVDNSDEYTERFNLYTSALQSLQLDKALWAGVYTQITDVEKEVNGILTYDRKVLKVNAEQQASIRSHIERAIRQRVTGAKSVVPAGDNSNTVYWQYTTAAPAEGWEQPGFDDSEWNRGAAGFGKIDQAAARVRTTWSTSEIWLRRTFQFDGLTQADLPNLCLRLFYDENTEVYINGVLAVTTTGYNTSYQLFAISEEARKAIHLDGENTIAIHTKQTSGGQYIDAGFSVLTYKNTSECTIEPMTVQTIPVPTEDPARAYLLCYSKTDDDRLFYAFSYDGVEWQPLHGGNSVYGGADGQPAVRRPFLFRLEDAEGSSTFHLVFGGSDDASGLYHLTSTDLINWTPLEGREAKLLDTEAIGPELRYDPVSKFYVYYWTRLSRGQYSFMTFRTPDFVTFTRQTTYFSPGFSAWDLHTFKATDTFVALFASDVKGLSKAVSISLNPTTKRFENPTSVFNPTRKISAPVVFESFDGNGWFFLGTEEDTSRLFSVPTVAAADLEFWEHPRARPVLPDKADGGKVLVITRNELAQLQSSLVAVPQLTVSPKRPDDTTLYNLQGIPVLAPHRPGIYVSVGKKILVK